MKLSSFLRLFLGVASFVVAGAVAFAQSAITLASGTVGVNYSTQITVSPAQPAGTTYALQFVNAQGSPINIGLAINSTSAAISGVPTVAGTFNGTVSVTNTATNNLPVVITIAPPAGTPAISSVATLSGTVGTAITPFAITGSNSPTSFNIGTLPAGLSVGGTTTAPTIIGTPTTAGTFTVAISANNGTGIGATQTLTITIAPASGTPVINSAATASGPLNTAFTYTITATNSPTSFAASGLPVGLSLNAATGAITGTPTVAGVYAVVLTATNGSGTGPASTVTFTLGSLSVISSNLTASGNVGTSFSHTIAATNSATSFNIGTLPAGLTANATSGTISGVPTAIGATSVTISANNATGTGPTATLVITINGALPPVIPPVVVPPVTGSAPVITQQPVTQTVAAGSTVTFTVVATGDGLNYQWNKNGTAIGGATSATLTLSNVTSADAAAYTVRVSNSAGAVTSSEATLTVFSAPVLPVITTQPLSQIVAPGGSVTLSVTATSTAALSYQWRRDGTAIAGATSASYTVSNITSASLGSYTVVVTNAAGSVTSNAAVLSFRSFAGSYFGSFGANGGTFSLFVRADGTGIFLGFARANRVALISREVRVGSDGRFSVAVPLSATGAATASEGFTRDIPLHEGEYHIDGSIAANGALTGTVSTLNLAFSAAAPTTSGATSGLAGFYQAGAAGTSANSYTIVGAGGDAFVLTVAGTSVDAGRGTVDASGRLDVTTDANARVSGTVNGTAGTIASTVTPATGTATNFSGANDDARTEVEKLINISTRSGTGGANVLIAGFVVTGDQPKSMLIRAVGPTLANFGLTGVLSAAHLEIFQGSTRIAQGDNWGAGTNASVIAATAVRVGAFALPAASRDAALLLTLPPGNYTAVVTGQGGVSGVALVEAYDATEGAISRTQRIVNISTRANAGSGENTLIAGFVITGSVPKRVLIRGVGPGLTQFGLTGVLARPSVAVFGSASATVPLAQNAGWSTSADAGAIAASAAQVGAFAFPANSADAALIVNLVPGAYTAQVSGVGGTSGTALIEVYELP